jgi:hypothetical protein
MKRVLELIEARTEEFRRLPLYAFMADRSVPPELRLPYAPHLAHFVLSFSDLCRLVLREEPARDPYQEVINQHAEEDSGHWQWFLSDLDKLGLDRVMSLGEALRSLWSPETEKTRLLTNRLCALSLGASSLHKLVVLKCVEATARVGMESTVRVAREVADRIGQKLLYYGSHHLEAESQHALGSDDVQRSLEGVILDEPAYQRLCGVVEQVFIAFADFVNELFQTMSTRAEASALR